jgi:hypothetical protein
METAEHLIDALYVVGGPQFMRDGKLKPIIQVCTASLIMHHPTMVNDFGITNLVCDAVLCAA